MNSFLEQYLPPAMRRATYKGIPQRQLPTPEPKTKKAPPTEDTSNIYRGTGQDLGEDVMYNRVNAKTGEKYDVPQNVYPGQGILADALSNITGQTDKENAILNGVKQEQSPGFLNSVLTDVTVGMIDNLNSGKGTAIEQPPDLPQTKIGPNTTLADLHEIQVTAQKRKKVETQNALAMKGAEGIVKSGGTEKDLKGWGKFTKEFDLQALGMALMATAGNNEGLIPNLGQALMYAKASREADVENEAAAAAAGRKEARDNARVKIEAAKVLATQEKNKADAQQGAADSYSKRISAEAAAAQAAASGVRAQAAMETAMNPKRTTVPANIKAYALLGASKAFPDLSETEKETLGSTIADSLAEEERLARAANKPFNIAARAEELARGQLGNVVQDDGWFSWSHDYNIPGLD